MPKLDGTVALITGGSRGIGAATAQRLASDGADVAITYARAGTRAGGVVDEIRSHGRRGLAIPADVADGDGAADAVDRTVAELGRIDILVNNAGIFPYGPFTDVTSEELDRTLALHVKAAFVAAQAAARHMTAGGRIISVGSNLAERVAAPGITLYAMSKSALTGLTKGLARDLGPRGITANLLHPGSTDTDMNPADDPGADAQRDLIPLGHFAEASDVASTIAHLAGAEGRYINGASITVDGGFTA